MDTNRYYSSIMELEESDDIKHIIRRWSNFSKNKFRLTQGGPVVLPDMLWVVKSGQGKTNLLHLISEYLAEEHLMEFCGDVKFIEFDFEYSASEFTFHAFDQFKDMLLNAAGFRNMFQGVICVNINEWVDHLDDRRFLSFVEYLSENSDIWHIIFSTDCSDQDKLVKLEAFLSVYFRIEKVRFKTPKASHFVNYIEQQLKKHQVTLDECARKILTETVEELQQTEYFDGYKTINMLCSDLIYRQFSADEFEGYVVGEKTALYYAKDSDFVTRTKQNIEKRKEIGFLTGGIDNEQ